MKNTNTEELSQTQSETPFYHKPSISKNLLTIQKKLLTISITSEFVIKNISNVHVRDSAVNDLYFLLQELSELIQNYGYTKE